MTESELLLKTAAILDNIGDSIEQEESKERTALVEKISNAVGLDDTDKELLKSKPLDTETFNLITKVAEKTSQFKQEYKQEQEVVGRLGESSQVKSANDNSDPFLSWIMS